jgi:PPOX class probable F420-dependent enzyme
MSAMSHDEYLQFLTESGRTMKVATVRADGSPHITPVWFALDGETIVFTTGLESAKAKHLLRDPRVALCVDDETPPFSYVIVEGSATLSDDLDALLQWATRIGGKYMGADHAEAYGQRNGVPGALLVCVTPAKILAEKDIAAE